MQANEIALVHQMRQLIVEDHLEDGVNGQNGKQNGRQIHVNVPCNGPCGECRTIVGAHFAVAQNAGGWLLDFLFGIRCLQILNDLR